MLSIVVDITQTSRGCASQRTLTKRSFVIGSAPDCDVVVTDDPDVVRAHLRVIVRRWDHAIVIRPIDGEVFVNQPIAIVQPTIVGEGDRVVIGRAELRFRAIGEAARGKRWWDPRDRDDGAVPAPPPPAPPDQRQYRMRTANPPIGGSFALPAGARHDVRPDDPMEGALFATLRDAPNDDAARMVYADWLEAAGRAAAAAAVRGHAVDRAALAAETHVAWRAIACSLPIIGCRKPACPSAWQVLAATEFDTQRACATCHGRVFFIATENEALVCSSNGAAVVLDPASARVSEALYRGMTGT